MPLKDVNFRNLKTALQCVLLAHSDESDGNLRQGVYI